MKLSDMASYDQSIASLSTLYSRSEGKLNTELSKFKRKSKICATAFCSRFYWFYIMNAYSFSFIITILALTLFSVDSKSPRNIQSSFTLILTSFFFKVYKYMN